MLAMRFALLFAIVLAASSVARAEPAATKPLWVPGQGTHNHAPATPQERLRRGALLGLLGGATLTVGAGVLAFSVGDDVQGFATSMAVGVVALPLGASLGTAVAGRERKGTFAASFGWSLLASVATVAAPTGLVWGIAGDPIGALVGGTLGLAIDLVVAPIVALAGFRHSERVRLAVMPQSGGARLALGGRF